MAKYKIGIELDNNKCIRNLLSTAFYTEEELIDRGCIIIDEIPINDEDIPLEMHGHYIYENYFMNKYHKDLFDEKYRCNFKYIDVIVELTEEEKEKFFPPVVAEPTFIELQNDINIDVDFRLSMLEMGI
nr:MAG TPA: hypothetical protein [Caudoviricetes sp.]